MPDSEDGTRAAKRARPAAKGDASDSGNDSDSDSDSSSDEATKTDGTKVKPTAAAKKGKPAADEANGAAGAASAAGERGESDRVEEEEGRNKPAKPRKVAATAVGSTVPQATQQHGADGGEPPVDIEADGAGDEDSAMQEEAEAADDEEAPHAALARQFALQMQAATEVLSRALALVSGHTQPIEGRSLLSAVAGAVTLCLRQRVLFQDAAERARTERRLGRPAEVVEFRGPGFVWGLLRKWLPEEDVGAVQTMRLCKDHHSAVFDVPTAKVRWRGKRKGDISTWGVRGG